MLRLNARFLLVIAFLLAAAGVIGIVMARNGGPTKNAQTDKPGKQVRQHRKQSYAELIAANYKVLKPQQTRRLIRYANAAYACMSERLDLGKPQASPTKIVMTLPSVATTVVLAQMTRCSAKIGDPPRNSSFQLRGRAVILYLPKYCILDKKTVVRSAPLPKP
jgi:hypothetical protein